MEFHLVTTILCVSVLLQLSMMSVHTAATFPLDEYWKSTLPNTTMPRAIFMDTRPGNGIAWMKLAQQKDLNGYQSNYARPSAADRPTNPPATLFFMEKELYKGNKMMMEIKRSANSTSVFLRRPRTTVSDSDLLLPLSADKLSLILNKYSIKDDSEEASLIKMTTNTCSLRAIKGEERKCVTSLESMIDFAISSLGTTNIQAYSTEAEKETQVQDFKLIKGIKKVGDEAVVVCHKEAYPYAVFLCHTLKPTKAYLVPLIGTTNVTNANAIAVCHMNTTEWNPGHLAFRVLGVKPGTIPICHFLPEVDVVWTRK